MYTNTGNRLYYVLTITQSLDNVTQTVIELSLLDPFISSGIAYSGITITQLSLYTNDQYIGRYNAFIKYINDTYFTSFEFYEMPLGIVYDISCVPTTTTTTTLAPSTTTSTTITPTTTSTTTSGCKQFTEQLGYSNISGADACVQAGILRDTYYGNDSNFALSTTISASPSCLFTVSGWWSNGVIWKYSPDGINLTTQGICGISTSTTTLPPAYGAIWYLTHAENSSINACANPTQGPYYSIESCWNCISKFYSDPACTIVYSESTTAGVWIGYTAVINGVAIYTAESNNNQGDLVAFSQCNPSQTYMTWYVTGLGGGTCGNLASGSVLYTPLISEPLGIYNFYLNQGLTTVWQPGTSSTIGFNGTSSRGVVTYVSNISADGVLSNIFLCPY